jgi:hypothetical protein
MPTLSELLEKMDEIRTLLMVSKDYISFMNKEIIGHKKIGPAPIYNFESPLPRYLKCWDRNLNQEDVELNNKVTLLINQNFLIRLRSLFEYYEVMKRGIDPPNNFEGLCKDIPEWEDMWILRRLRNKFGHGPGSFNISDEENIELYEQIVYRYRIDSELWEEYYPDEFPLSIEKVLLPMFNNCYKYVESFKTIMRRD